MLRDALKRMGRADLIGNGERHLIPNWQPKGTRGKGEGVLGAKTFRTQRSRPKAKSD